MIPLSYSIAHICIATRTVPSSALISKEFSLRVFLNQVMGLSSSVIFDDSSLDKSTSFARIGNCVVGLLVIMVSFPYSFVSSTELAMTEFSSGFDPGKICDQKLNKLMPSTPLWAVHKSSTRTKLVRTRISHFSFVSY